MPSLSNRAIIAAAGSRKTQLVIDAALAAPADRRVLITTYTTENCVQISHRREPFALIDQYVTAFAKVHSRRDELRRLAGT